ncbi:MAG TPA: CBS domain-containing protein [Vicinamibacterales bacterium]|nr:CBS domain-containing protein [Vicinamibacterales bacterium]
MKLRDVMTHNPRSVEPSATIREAARIMRDEDTGVVPIVENGRPVGVVTDRDIVVRAVAEEGGRPDRAVRDIASTNLITAGPDLTTEEAARLMGEHQVRRVLICQDDRLVGIASIGDLAVKGERDRRIGDALQDISQGVKRR